MTWPHWRPHWTRNFRVASTRTLLAARPPAAANCPWLALAGAWGLRKKSRPKGCRAAKDAERKDLTVLETIWRERPEGGNRLCGECGASDPVRGLKRPVGTGRWPLRSLKGAQHWASGTERPGSGYKTRSRPITITPDYCCTRFRTAWTPCL